VPAALAEGVVADHSLGWGLGLVLQVAVEEGEHRESLDELGVVPA
jgi:hypothetical protein